MVNERPIREVLVSDSDRERVAVLMAETETEQRDIEIEAILAPYFGRLATITPVPAGHTHDGKKHEGIEIHFRPGARSARARRAGVDDVESGNGDFVSIIGGCVDPPRNLPPEDPNAELCYLDPPGICRSC